MSHDYERVRIQGRLACLSPLSIGNGGMPAAIEDRESRPGNRLDICAHPDGTPYIPATSLRGLLRALLGEGEAHRDDHRDLFGEMRGGRRGKNDESKASRLRVFDADLCESDKAYRTRTAIDPVTGTAKDNCLYQLVQIPAGGQFRCEFELERVNRDHVKTFLGLLNTLDENNPKARLGRGGNKAEGRVRWALGKVETLRPADLAAWLAGAKPGLAECCRNETKVFDRASLDLPDEKGRYLKLQLQIKPKGWLLVDAEEAKESVNGQERKLARCRLETRAGKTCLIAPASSLRGLLRGHCRKILMTLLAAKLRESPPYATARTCADTLINDLFGHQRKASAVSLEDAVGHNVQTHRQTFNAVDRFTGGVLDSALYTVEAAWQGSLDTRLRIDTHRIKTPGDWWKGLLVLALRDAMEGDLALGWGKAKGYGAFTLAIRWEGQKDYWAEWDKLREAPGLPDAISWVKALHQQLDEPAALPASPAVR